MLWIFHPRFGIDSTLPALDSRPPFGGSVAPTRPTTDDNPVGVIVCLTDKETTFMMILQYSTMILQWNWLMNAHVPKSWGLRKPNTLRRKKDLMILPPPHRPKSLVGSHGASGGGHTCIFEAFEHSKNVKALVTRVCIECLAVTLSLQGWGGLHGSSQKTVCEGVFLKNP